MGSARKSAQPNGRGQGDGIAVIRKTPFRGIERRDHLLTAPTAAQMGCCPEPLRDVEHAFFEFPWDELDMAMSQLFPLGHTISSSAIAFVEIW